jgi:hypothetical protein
MAVQIFLVHPKANDDDDVRERIAEFVAQRGGFILMATSYGSLLTAFDDQYLDTVKAHHLVEFAGGVTLNPNAPGAAALQRLFAENVAAQLVDRGMVQPGLPALAQPSPLPDAFPLGYRPLRWPTAAVDNEMEGGE